MTDVVLDELARSVGAECVKRDLMIATAESCTGGWVAEALTSIAGSSAWFERGFVAYTYISKREMLGVTSATLGSHGAVSEATVREMASGALQRSHAQVSIAVSGTAGPSGGTAEKPVGTVCFAWALTGGRLRSETRRFDGDREAVRRQSAIHALRGVLSLLSEQKN
jgi:nicotinamide-nucleotide amidase